jgi:glucose-1-phosphate cytidylyltransferase
MQVVILAGGLGTRISEHTDFIPKPMIKIGNYPIVFHIVKYFYEYGHKDFIICSGYKNKILSEFFEKNFFYKRLPDAKIKVIFTGNKSKTGERIRRIKKYIKNDFFITYGDGLSDVNLNNLVKFHKKHKKILSVLAVKPPPRYGKLTIKGNVVQKIYEKDVKKEKWINGGFFVCNKKIFDFVKKNSTFETDIIPKIIKIKSLLAYKKCNFWFAVDTLKDKRELEDLWFKNKAPWKIW